VLVAGAGAVGDQLIPLFKKQFGGWVPYATAAFAVVFIVALVKVDWRKALGRWWPTGEDHEHAGEPHKAGS
jgi:hypothetical protein